MNSTATEQAFARVRRFAGWRLADTAFCFASAIVLYCRFFRFPAIPIAPATGDQSIFLLGATRMLEGQIIYRDFFQFTTPGTEFLYFVLIKVFGQNASLPWLITIAVGVAYAALGLRISRHVVSGWRVYLGPLLFLTAGFLPSPDATHHVFSTLVVLWALDLLLCEIDESADKPSLYWFVGTLCALSCFFTPTRGVLAVLAVCFTTLRYRSIWPDASARRRTLHVLIGFLAGLIVLLGPTVWFSGAQNVWKDMVDFTFQNSRAMPFNNLRSYGTDLPIAGFGMHTFNTVMDAAGIAALIKWLLIYLINPGIYLLCAVDLGRRRAAGYGAQERKLVLIAVTGCALFVSVAYAPTQFRMGVVSMPATILTAWFLRSDRSLSRIAALVLLSFAAVVALAGILHSQRNTVTVLSTPTGELAITDSVFASSAEEYAWLKDHSQRGDFLFSQNPEYYYLFRLRHPGPVPFLTIYDYTTDEQVQETLADIERHRVQYILWPTELQLITRLTEGVPANQDHLQPLRDLMKSKYRLVHTFSDFDEVWQRK